LLPFLSVGALQWENGEQTTYSSSAYLLFTAY